MECNVVVFVFIFLGRILVHVLYEGQTNANTIAFNCLLLVPKDTLLHKGLDNFDVIGAL